MYWCMGAWGEASWLHPHHPWGHGAVGCKEVLSDLIEPSCSSVRTTITNSLVMNHFRSLPHCSDCPVKYESGEFSVTKACLTEPLFRHPVSALVTASQPDSDRFNLLLRQSGESPVQAWACHRNAWANPARAVGCTCASKC
jgi:hypothetical protein